LFFVCKSFVLKQRATNALGARKNIQSAKSTAKTADRREHVLTPVNPPVIDNRSSDGENRLSRCVVRATRERRVFLYYVWYKPTVPRARPDPFDSQGDQWRTKVTHMQAAHRSWLVRPPRLSAGCP